MSGGHMSSIEVVDSYLPDYISPRTYVPLPQRFVTAFGEMQVEFIAGNKF